MRGRHGRRERDAGSVNWSHGVGAGETSTW